MRNGNARDHTHTDTHERCRAHVGEKSNHRVADLSRFCCSFWPRASEFVMHAVLGLSVAASRALLIEFLCFFGCAFISSSFGFNEMEAAVHGNTNFLPTKVTKASGGGGGKRTQSSSD